MIKNKTKSTVIILILITSIFISIQLATAISQIISNENIRYSDLNEYQNFGIRAWIDMYTIPQTELINAVGTYNFSMDIWWWCPGGTDPNGSRMRILKNGDEIFNVSVNATVVNYNITISDMNKTDTITVQGFSYDPDPDNNPRILMTNIFLKYDYLSPSLLINSPTPLNNSINTTRNVSINSSILGTWDITTSLVNWNSSLVGWWRFNEIVGGTNIEDFSGNSNNGTFNGNTTSNITVGKFGNALKLNGVDDYVSLFSIPAITLNGNYSITGWFNANNVMGKKTLFSQTLSSNDCAIFVINNSYLQASHYDGKNYIAPKNSSVLSNNTWYFFAYTYSNGSSNLYINTVLNTSIPSIFGLVSETPGTFFGQATNGNNKFNGSIDEVRIYNRNISHDEINASYNSTANLLIANFTNLSNGNYNYTIYAQSEDGALNSTKRYVIVDPNVPATPEILFPENNTRQWNNSINFSWNVSTDKDYDPITYIYSIARDSEFTLNPRGDTTSNNDSGIWTAQVHGAAYYLRVKSYDGYQYSPDSNIIEFIENSKPLYTNNILSKDSFLNTLDATFDVTDSEGDIVTNYTRWYKNDTLQPLLNDSLVILGDNLSVGQTWYFEVYGYDGYENSTPKQSNTILYCSSVKDLS
jgi:hypothetical protein